MSHRSFIAAVALLSGSLAATASASPITYTESATASGSLGGQSFTNAFVSLTSTGDTSNVLENTSGVYYIVLPVQLTISGLGSALFSDTLQFASNPSVSIGGPGNTVVGAAGVGDDTLDRAVLFTDSTAFVSYNLQSAFGPISGNTNFNPGTAFATTAGAFILNATSFPTFQAVTSVTPEPSSFALLGTGLLGIAGMVRKRFA